MTIQPLDELDDGSVHLLTIEEYAALGETEHGYTELIEGRLIMSPSPVPDHNNAALELAVALRPRLPEDFEVQMDVDVDLQLALSDEPGSSRRPDLIVVQRDARKRVRSEGGMIRASEVLLAVEIVSPSSKRMDHVHKRNDYADAGIPNYWIIDIDDPISLTACRLTEQFGYQDDQVVTGTFRTDVPFPVEINLDRLV
ncbi:Uma2 family endonuclease [Actinophytocola sp. NPDC049390]|uniref:Uma2 family endonuclease n=1 Tax=Actinophytocola sp. NPDC049390 TaxID=3363894 RepID=UPI0037B5B039